MQEKSEKNKINQSKKKLKQHCGRDGYYGVAKKMKAAAIESGDKAAEDPNYPDHLDVFVKAHTPKDPKKPTPPEVQELKSAMVSIQTKFYICCSIVVNAFTYIVTCFFFGNRKR